MRYTLDTTAWNAGMIKTEDWKMTITNKERDELTKLVKARARVANASVDQRKAELLEDVARRLRFELDRIGKKIPPREGEQQYVTAADEELIDRLRKIGSLCSSGEQKMNSCQSRCSKLCRPSQG